MLSPVAEHKSVFRRGQSFRATRRSKKNEEQAVFISQCISKFLVVVCSMV